MTGPGPAAWPYGDPPVPDPDGFFYAASWPYCAGLITAERYRALAEEAASTR